jgi:NifB/MoaA-like Fe-S oxidoreductase
MITEFGDQCRAETGSRIFFPSDEFYVKGGLPLPPEEFYEGYPQIENGVGMLRSFETEFGFGLEDLADLTGEISLPRRVSVATGVAAYDYMKRLCDALSASVPGLTVSVYRIVNHFFGESITVAGLLTGKDMKEQLCEKELGDVLLIPSNTLRADGDLFLCGMTPTELSEALGVPVIPAPNDGEAFVRTVLGC